MAPAFCTEHTTTFRNVNFNSLCHDQDDWRLNLPKHEDYSPKALDASGFPSSLFDYDFSEENAAHAPAPVETVFTEEWPKECVPLWEREDTYREPLWSKMTHFENYHSDPARWVKILEALRAEAERRERWAAYYELDDRLTQARADLASLDAYLDMLHPEYKAII